jgi:hypothetical protein
VREVRNRRDPDTRYSPRQAFQQLAVGLDDPAYPLLELGVLLSALYGLAKRKFDGFVQAVTFSSRKGIGVCG